MWATTSAAVIRWPAAMRPLSTCTIVGSIGSECTVTPGSVQTALARSATPRKSRTRRIASCRIWRASDASSAPRWLERKSTGASEPTRRKLEQATNFMDFGLAGGRRAQGRGNSTLSQAKKSLAARAARHRLAQLRYLLLLLPED